MALYPWKQDEAYQSYIQSIQQPTTQKPKKKKKSVAPPAGQQMIGGTSTNAPYTPPASGGVSGTRFGGSGIAPPSGTGASRGIQPQSISAATARQGSGGSADYGGAIHGVESQMHGPIGSYVSDYFENPMAGSMVAGDPYAQSNILMQQQYGLPYGSNAAGIYADYLNPQDKWAGLGIEQPGNNSDWIALGEQLMGQASNGPGGGTQLNPKVMIGNIVQTVLAETQAQAKGGEGSGGSQDPMYNPLRALVNQDPMTALNSFASIVEGALKGTMPAEQLSGYVAWLKQVGGQFAMEWLHGDIRQMASQGENFITHLVDKLGPTLGL